MPTVWGITRKRYTFLLFIKIMQILLGAGQLFCLIFTLPRPALNFAGWAEISFCVISVISIIQATFSISFGHRKFVQQFDPRYKLILAAAIMGSGIGLIYHTFDLEQRGIPRCLWVEVEGKGRSGDDDQSPCHVFGPKLVGFVLAVASATLFVLTALKWTINTYVPNSSGEDDGEITSLGPQWRERAGSRIFEQLQQMTTKHEEHATIPINMHRF